MVALNHRDKSFWEKRKEYWVKSSGLALQWWPSWNDHACWWWKLDSHQERRDVHSTMVGSLAFDVWLRARVFLHVGIEPNLPESPRARRRSLHSPRKMITSMNSSANHVVRQRYELLSEDFAIQRTCDLTKRARVLVQRGVHWNH